MTENRKVDVALFSAPEDPRAVEVAGRLEAAASESAHPILDHPVFELLFASLSLEQVAVNVIRMAHDLSLHPMADGVSPADQADFLASHGCSEMQVFFFSAAIPPEVFREKLEIE